MWLSWDLCTESKTGCGEKNVTKLSMGWVSLLAVTKLARAAATSLRSAQYFSTDCYVVWRLLFMERAPSSKLVNLHLFLGLLSVQSVFQLFSFCSLQALCQPCSSSLKWIITEVSSYVLYAAFTYQLYPQWKLWKEHTLAMIQHWRLRDLTTPLIRNKIIHHSMLFSLSIY